MGIRPLDLPGDLEELAQKTIATFQYPENPAWSVQPDEAAGMADTLRNYRRMWLLVRLIQRFSRGFRDLIHGLVWEEMGEIVGYAMASRRGTTDSWLITTVGVLPEYRRRGIARQLVLALLELIRDRGGRTVLLDVIDGNAPAVALYTSLGFEHFTGEHDLIIQPPGPAAAPPQMPEGYRQERSDAFDWRPRMALMARITPPASLHYEPVEEGRFRRPALARLLFPLASLAEGTKTAWFLVRETPGGEVVAYGRREARVRQTGRSLISLQTDPARAELAPYLVRYALDQVTGVSPERGVELTLPDWNRTLIEAAEAAGFEHRMHRLRLGLLL